MNDKIDSKSEARLASALRSAPETEEQPSPALHERIMAGVRAEPSTPVETPLKFHDLFRPLLALAAVGALAAGVTLVVVVNRQDAARTERARAFVRVTHDLTQSARAIERQVFDRASEVFIDPMERQALEIENDARALIQRVRDAFPELVEADS